ncbi:hypothetical protein PoB_004086600 [Plakobranchus ocellatus]|uniref:Nuclear nucleic acid-binding protein C1D n=1 Tax=Plakobranchus ocellatus TaxID=259542 RepID=A0AAV4B1I1_9GAST|nr:hypothetical protein PoB_004086600 [Plakobranchus ocellatus]
MPGALNIDVIIQRLTQSVKEDNPSKVRSDKSESDECDAMPRLQAMKVTAINCLWCKLSAPGVSTAAWLNVMRMSMMLGDDDDDDDEKEEEEEEYPQPIQQYSTYCRLLHQLQGTLSSKERVGATGKIKAAKGLSLRHLNRFSLRKADTKDS